MTPLEALIIAAGVLILLATFFDLFQSVVLPRPAVRKFTITRTVVRPLWRVWRWVALRSTAVDRSEARLGAFGPSALIVLFFIWAVALVLGYALIIYGLQPEFRPELKDFPDAFYVSATTLVPLAYGDVVPQEGWARALIIIESANGVAFAAVAITLLFELYGSFRTREEKVVALDALAGAPASAVQLLETAAAPHMDGKLRETFEEWRDWAAMVLESHLAYPILVYFRSSHDNEAWVNSFGAVMDAAVLILSSVPDHESSGSAKLMLTVGNHFAEDIAWVFRFKPDTSPIIEREEYVAAIARLKAAGYAAQDGDLHWQKFAKMRGNYATVLNRLASILSLPPAPWVGDRSYLPHRARPRRRRPAPATAKPAS